MAKSKQFTLDDLKNKGYIDDGTGNFKKTVLSNGDAVHFKPLPLFDECPLLPQSKVQLTKLTKEKKEKKSTEVYFKNMTITDVFEQAEKEGFIFIPLNVPSLKNSKQMFKNKRTGKNFVTSSDLCKEYISNTKIHWLMFKSRFLKMIEGKEFPLTIQLFFIRDQHRAFDYGNISQIVWDCMSGSAYFPKVRKNKELNQIRNKQRKEFSWIDDDDADHLIPDFSSGYGYDPKLPGVIIKVL